MKLQEWIDLNRLDAQIHSNICSIDNKKLLILDRGEDEQVFDDDFDLIINSNEQAVLIQSNIDSVLFEFGNNWYYSEIDKIKLVPFKYIGKEKSDFDFQFPYLGIHGEYDLCNGSRLYKDWCEKAKFLNSPSLAICENNTLAGTLSFQLACKDAGIKSILGETVTVSRDLEKKSTYQVKLYAKNYEGWINLLNINAQIKVFNDGFVLEEYLLSRSNGLICVLTNDFKFPLLTSYQKAFGGDLYYQLDFVEWLSEDKEKSYLANIKFYIENHIDAIKPVLICDSFYLDKDQGHIKKILNSIGKLGFQNQSHDQYFKSIQDIYHQIDELAPSEEWIEKVFFQGVENATEISDKCDFQIKLGELHLPQYEMTKEEGDQFKTNEELFYYLIQKGFDEKKIDFVKEEENYFERIETEVEVIKSGALIDYFLILADIINWCGRNDILIGAGRGSAAGSLVSYLLGVTQIDPLKFDLLFERFLNSGRVGKSLPDIDSDFPSNRRDDVKRYMESRYGVDYVTSIGTYGTFKIRSGISDLCREYNFDLKMTKYITSIIAENSSFTEFFKIAAQIPVVKSFVQDNPLIVETYPLLSEQVKNASIHAAGVIIVPKTYNDKPMTIYDWIPVKKMDGVLVTEWEGPVLETAGYLKEDILGTKQLEKLAEIFTLIKQNHNKQIIFRDIPLDDQEVFELFRGGYNEDVFQLGAVGLKSYCRELKPDTIEDLIATVALYRPGPMESGAHKTYIKIKNGLRAPEYDYMLEEVTKNTHSMYIYQEQVMQAMQVLGGFNLIEADDVRKALGKKDAEKMSKYKIQFIDSAIGRGCDKFEAVGIWNKLEVFAEYGFNKSHAACYAHIGYHCQWLKSHYPLEFWSVALNFSSQDEIARRIAEMHKVSSVKVLPPDINQSTNIFVADRETNVIFWSIGSIKFIGEKALEAIMSERVSRGRFFTFDEFIGRIEKRVVNKRCVVNLILSGCFDKIEKISSPKERLTLLKKFLDNDLSEEFSNSGNWKDYFWILKQKELTGFGYLEFDKIYNSYIFPKLKGGSKLKFVDSLSFQSEDSIGDKKCIVGILSEIIVRNSVKGPFAQLIINCNDENIVCLIWSEIWGSFRELVESSKNKIVCITGEIKFDKKYKMENVLQTNLQTQIEVL